MIIEFLAQYSIAIAALCSLVILLFLLRKFRSTDDVFENDIADEYLKASGGYVKSDKLFIIGDHSGGFEVRSEWLGSSGSSVSYGDWDYASGTVIQINGFDPYRHPVMREHEIVKCEYCKRQNKSTNEFCSGCGASL